MRSADQIAELTQRGDPPGDDFMRVVERLEQEGDPAGWLDRKLRALDQPKHGPPEDDGFEGLVATLRSRLDLPRPARVLAALRNAELRAAFLHELGALTAAEVATLAGSRARNSSSLAGRWRAERRIFSVAWGGEHLYPLFQFVDGQPRPTIARVLRTFGDRPSGWEVALWFALPSPHLPGQARPVDLLDDEDALAAAAAADVALPEF